MWDGCGSSLCHISYQKNALRALTCMPSVSTSRKEEMYLANGLGFLSHCYENYLVLLSLCHSK